MLIFKQIDKKRLLNSYINTGYLKNYSMNYLTY